MELTNDAVVLGLPNARFWGDEWPEEAMARFREASDEALQRQFPAIYGVEHNYIAISGGGANGAFGAGLLAGWAAAGTRPQFTMVTGISTGALTAPFVFLGPKYDPVLKKLYTTSRTEDIVRQHELFTVPFRDAMADTSPLQRLLETYVTDELIDEIAAEHRKGRRLFVGTMNLDASRSVIWDLGAMANSTDPRRYRLIRDVLRASASIPVAFPPVLFEVEAGGRTYDEMHVDGGTGSQVFVYPAAVDWRQITQRLKVRGTPKVYVLRNSFLDPDYNGVKPTLLPIASRAIDALIRTQGIGDLYQIYALCRRDGNDFNLAYIPSDFTEKATEPFDPEYMRKLYDHGYRLGRSGYRWKKAPPHFLWE